jgi:prepilin-type N-terminal cleavage/methylation domain-containing protein
LNRGFTLLEILTALVIMGVVMGLGAPRFREFMTHESVRQARVTVTTRLAGARVLAVQRGCQSVLHFESSSSRVWTTACRLTGGGVDTVGLIDNLASRYGVVFAATGDSVLFTPQGIAFNATWITMVFSKEGYSGILDISPVGRPIW